MSSIHQQDGKPNWFCAFYDPEGFRRFRTTGTHNAQLARTICTAIERAAFLARKGKLSSEKAIKLIRETCADIKERHGPLPANAAHTVLKASFEEFVRLAGGELESYTVRSWLEGWLKNKTDASKATLVEYRRIVDLFLNFLGARADRALTTLQSKQIEDFKNQLIERVAPSTVNKAVKVLKASFANAVAKRQLEFSPAEHVASIDTEVAGRRPFTLEEIGKLLKAADREWQTMILLGYYTALRLRDCAGLTWEHVDLLTGTISVATEKTSRKQIIPISEPLARHLSKLAGDKPDAPLCPSLHALNASKLSAQFYEVMVKAGLVEARDYRSKGKGRGARRDLNKISFHSLRYSAGSTLRSEGVSEAISMDILGHDTEAVHRHYSKADLESKRGAVNKMPDITS